MDEISSLLQHVLGFDNPSTSHEIHIRNSYDQCALDQVEEAARPIQY